jgi:hypothetical protein
MTFQLLKLENKNLGSSSSASLGYSLPLHLLLKIEKIKTFPLFLFIGGLCGSWMTVAEGNSR